MRKIIVLLAFIALTALALGACTPAPPPTAAPPAVEEPVAMPEATEAPAAAVEEPMATEAPAATAEPTTAPEATAEPAMLAAEANVPLDENAPVKVESARAIIDVVGDRKAVLAALSPDGAHLAYFLPGSRRIAGQICIFTFDSAAKNCNDLPLDQFRGYPYQLQWSPDSAMIAFTENPIDLGNDADIWTLTVADGSVKNLTDDGVVGAWTMPTGTPSAVVDFLPMWGPTDGKIYFWRYQGQGAFGNYTLGIYSLDAAGGEPVMVADVAAAVPLALPIFHQERFSMDGPSAISSDGTHVAVQLTALGDLGQSATGLYVINLADGTATMLMDAEAYNAALPEWNDFPATPSGVSWTADSKAVVTMSTTSNSREPFTVFYYADAAGGGVTPVVDFSTLATREDYMQPLSGTTIPARWFSPWTGTLSPNGDKVLMVNDLTGITGLMSANLPPTGTVPAISATTDVSLMSTASRSSRSADGKVTIYGLLLTVTE